MFPVPSDNVQRVYGTGRQVLPYSETRSSHIRVQTTVWHKGISELFNSGQQHSRSLQGNLHCSLGALLKLSHNGPTSIVSFTVVCYFTVRRIRLRLPCNARPDHAWQFLARVISQEVSCACSLNKNHKKSGTFLPVSCFHWELTAWRRLPPPRCNEAVGGSGSRLPIIPATAEFLAWGWTFRQCEYMWRLLMNGTLR